MNEKAELSFAIVLFSRKNEKKESFLDAGMTWRKKMANLEMGDTIT